MSDLAGPWADAASPPDEGMDPHPADLAPADVPTTDAPVKPDGERVAPAKPSGPTPEQLAEYDAESIRLINDAEALARAADGEWASLKEATAEAKKRAEGKVCDLRDLIRARQDNRGREPEKTLLDFAKPEAPKWRGYDIDTLALHRDTRKVLNENGVTTLGELHAAVTTPWEAEQGPPFGLALNTVADLREAVQRIIDAEFNATEEAGRYGGDLDPADRFPELWREYPIDRWERFGITPKDAEKLAAGEVKRETGRKPVRTVGDLSDFSKPTAGGYSRGYGDVKGIGAAGAERIADAEMGFWKWWNGGGLEEFARERGLHCEPVAGAGSGVPVAGGSGGAGGDVAPFDPNAGPGDAEGQEEGPAPLDSADTTGTFSGKPYDRGQTAGW